jgi:hypothetical protein
VAEEPFYPGTPRTTAVDGIGSYVELPAMALYFLYVSWIGERDASKVFDTAEPTPENIREFWHWLHHDLYRMRSLVNPGDLYDRILQAYGRLAREEHSRARPTW